MSRRASRPNAAAAANTWVTRTPSGLPLCRTCHKELGFCSHSPMITRDRSKSVSRDRSGSIIGQSLVPVLSSSGNSPSAVAANAATGADDRTPQKQKEGDAPPNRSGRGTKRHCSGAQGVASGKGKRRGISAQRKVSIFLTNNFVHRLVRLLIHMNIIFRTLVRTRALGSYMLVQCLVHTLS